MRLITLFWLLGTALFADIVVIVNLNNENETLSAKEIKRIYLGKTNHFPDGSKAVPLDQESSSDTFEDFYKAITGKSVAAINRYRARRSFSGKGSSPRGLESAGEVILQVKSNENMIGYVDRIDVTDDVKVVYTIK